ncbi:MAG: glycosyltransferase family 4 protein [Candidatus Falkowbacteria bacterium]
MKKTLLITLDFAPMVGGIATYWSNLCKNLPREDIVVLAPEAASSLDFDMRQPYLIYRYNLLWPAFAHGATSGKLGGWIWPKWLPFLRHAWKLCRREKIEQIIVGQILPGAAIALILKFFLRIPYFVSLHGMDIARCGLYWRKKWLAKKILAKADAIITNSEFTMGLVQNFTEKLPERRIVVYPCPNENVILMPRAADLLVRRLGLDKFKNNRVLLTVGRLVERKGHDQVISALQFLRDKYPDLVYLIVGRGQNQEKLERRIKDANLAESVYLFTKVRNDELPLFYDIANIFIMPSRELPDGDVEGFGIVYLEAALCGKPAIAGKSGGVSEAVEHNKTGILVNPEDVGDIVKAISRLLDDGQFADLLGQRANARARKEFQWAKQAEKLIKILE